MKTTHDVLIHFIKDLHSAARQQLSYFPTVAEEIAPLREGLSAHIQEISEQLGRLNSFGEVYGIDNMQGVHCKGMEGLIKEVRHIMDDLDDDADDDAKVYALVGALRRCKHYEIAGYETVLEQLDPEHHSVFESILGEAKNADSKLVEHLQ